jgi:hypothetical protein
MIFSWDDAVTDPATALVILTSAPPGCGQRGDATGIAKGITDAGRADLLAEESAPLLEQ